MTSQSPAKLSKLLVTSASTALKSQLRNEQGFFRFGLTIGVAWKVSSLVSRAWAMDLGYRLVKLDKKSSNCSSCLTNPVEKLQTSRAVSTSSSVPSFRKSVQLKIFVKSTTEKLVISMFDVLMLAMNGWRPAGASYPWNKYYAQYEVSPPLKSYLLKIPWYKGKEKRFIGVEFSQCTMSGIFLLFFVLLSIFPYFM